MREGGMMRVLFYLFISAVVAFGMPISEKYPSYSYVFNEFDITDDYIYDESFAYFSQKYEKQYQNFYKDSLRRGGHLIPTFKSMLLRDGLSDLFVYMSIIESGMNTDSKSSKNALGIWQFMRDTAKQYHLDVNSDFDERLDPILSTNAAMRYMHKLYEDFGKWYLVAMAYNCGEGRLQKGIAEAGTDDIVVLMDEDRSYIPLETRTYIKKILLVAMIGENVSLGFDTNKDAVTQLYGDGVVQVEVDPGEHLDKIARLINMDPKDLLKLNHHFKDGVVPVKLPMYKINVPNIKVIDFYALYRLKKELEYNERDHFISHQVKKDEKIESIAKTYHTTISGIMAHNALRSDILRQHQVLAIPVNKKVFMKYSSSNLLQ
jgi:membrane-bound lytic murein transglycosylase D